MQTYDAFAKYVGEQSRKPRAGHVEPTDLVRQPTRDEEIEAAVKAALADGPLNKQGMLYAVWEAESAKGLFGWPAEEIMEVCRTMWRRGAIKFEEEMFSA